MTTGRCPSVKGLTMAKRVSQYAVFGKHRYQSGEPNSAVSRVVYLTSRAKVLVSPAATVDLLEHGRLDALSPSEESALEQAGLLVDEAADERAVAIERQRASSQDDSTHAFVLVPTAYCNMGCDYCGQTHVKKPYSAEHRASVEQRVTDAIEDSTCRTVEVRWFGGEPTMAWASIRSMSQHFVAAADRNDTDYRALIVTNGALVNERKLHEMQDDLAIHDLCVTVDGVGSMHDSHRPLKSGKGSFQRIMDWLTYVATHPAELPDLHVTVRTNVDVNNADQFDAFIEEMAERGFGGRPNITFNISPVYAWSNDVSHIRISKDKFAREEAGWLQKMSDLQLDVPLLPAALRTALCPAVSSNEEVISATGKIFSCTEHPLVDQHEASDGLGSVTELPWPGRRPTGLYDKWHDQLASADQLCSACSFLPVCGGACPKHWAEGDPPCPTYKFSIQERLDIAARRNGLRSIDSNPVLTGA
jgi:uncharacterized protein